MKATNKIWNSVPKEYNSQNDPSQLYIHLADTTVSGGAIDQGVVELFITSCKYCANPTFELASPTKQISPFVQKMNGLDLKRNPHKSLLQLHIST